LTEGDNYDSANDRLDDRHEEQSAARFLGLAVQFIGLQLLPRRGAGEFHRCDHAR
jgi:hypothetical protein